MGRPPCYTEAKAAEICARLAEGYSLTQICRAAPHLPSQTTVHNWVNQNHEGFAERYARARDLGLDNMAEALLEIVDTDANIPRARVRIDARKWYLARMAPRRYGDTVNLRHTGADGSGPVEFSDIEMATRIAGILESARVRMPASQAAEED
jgi:hypothetical protein